MHTRSNAIHIKSHLSFQFQRNAFQSEKGASINLVPEYNSDEDDSDNEVDNDSTTNTIDSSKLASLPDAATTNLNPIEENKSMSFTKNMSSFASIIVGGRSPSQESQNLSTPDAESIGGATNTADPMLIETEHLPQKQFKRKRRIEYSISHKRDANQSENPGGADATTVPEEICENSSAETTVSSNKLAAGNLYEHFQRESGESQHKSDRKSVEPEPIVDVQKINEEISQTKAILEAKLHFLCQGQTEIELKPVQVMHIQLQVRCVRRRWFCILFETVILSVSDTLRGPCSECVAFGVPIFLVE